MKKIFCFVPVLMVLAGCAGAAPENRSGGLFSGLFAESSKQAGSGGGMDLDAAVKEAAARMETRLPGGTKMALISVASSSAQLSEYVIGRLEAALVDGGKLMVVDRANLDKVRAEQGFQLSGEVDDDSAKSIGKLLGAGAIVTGAFTDLGDVYSLSLKAINIETALVAVSYPADITKSTRIETMLASGGGAGTGGGAGPGTAQAGGRAAPAAPAKEYKIGDTGPAGGLVFFDMGFHVDGWRYLEAAPQDFPTGVQWGELDVLNELPETGIGKGNSNTTSIVSILKKKGQSMRAAQVVTLPQYGGFDDWFLPSRDELNLMYENLKKQRLGGFSNTVYWSSSTTGNYIDVGHVGVWQINFSDGRRVNAHYWNEGSVRAIRRF
jgi:hypothetical protein